MSARPAPPRVNLGSSSSPCETSASCQHRRPGNLAPRVDAARQRVDGRECGVSSRTVLISCFTVGSTNSERITPLVWFSARCSSRTRNGLDIVRRPLGGTFRCFAPLIIRLSFPGLSVRTSPKMKQTLASDERVHPGIGFGGLASATRIWSCGPGSRGSASARLTPRPTRRGSRRGRRLSRSSPGGERDDESGGDGAHDDDASGLSARCLCDLVRPHRGRVSGSWSLTLVPPGRNRNDAV
jgi:hypothetical protein